MQSMPYYQSGYQAPTSYSNNGSPVPASVMNTGAPPPMMPPTMSHPPIPEAANAAPPPQQPPKRKQVKNACTNYRKSPRCIKYGIADTCVNSVRKERKKGIKRGPYKRRQKEGGSSTSRKGDEQLVNQQAAANPYAMRPGTMPFGYPGTLNQYGQPTYDPYGSYAATAYHKDMPYVVNPMYSSMGYPVMMSGSSSDANQQHHQGQQQQHHPSAGQQQPQPQQQQSPVPTQYTMMHPQASRYGEHVLHSPQSQSPTAAHMYYQQQQPHQQQQHQQSRLSPQLPEIKHDPHQQQHDSSHQYMKPQPMTPVPSASNSSITSTPPPHADSAAGGVAPTAAAPGGGEDESKYERLSQLCSAALHSDSSQQNHSPQPSQQ
ncbi:hypothetical protein RO3G_16326 [Lichtheimia corymbifera JMRC:FSU:9682]|uniref:Uncharacterized protein n=1 Tax=Lichtheimia corymbifera JMRC:FSU:9682 TaxID=1263082 RepID=A0A068RPY9_9FUNG|nr:hypothetical protein RO3G_16326 [Lichtheimia corymbifera JMRC:FSU:9682]